MNKQGCMENTTIVVPPELFAPAESSSFKGIYDLPSFDVGPDVYVFKQPLDWNVQVTNTSGALLVMGSVKGVGTTECGRCLEGFDVEIDGEIEGFFVIKNDDEENESEIEEEEFDLLGPDNTIDLVPLIQAAIIVDLPLLPLCDDDCKGICQDCGVNLNEQECDCAKKRDERKKQDEAAANPFAVLAQLNFEEK